jgi:hypothetical protein
MKNHICPCQTPASTADLIPFTLNISTTLLEQLQAAASLAKTDAQSLMRCYIEQGLAGSTPQLKRQQFLTHAKDVLAQHGIHDKTIEELFGQFPY